LSAAGASAAKAGNAAEAAAMAARPNKLRRIIFFSLYVVFDVAFARC
jgi:hypothetical protein